ncbi:response regulator [Cyanobacteria bacterium FACHB-63]|nr:response regulator [Cyanobacteria bacterium FACHB-63]
MPLARPSMDELHGLKILVVDDDPDSCVLLALLLAEAATQVETVGSSEEALRQLEQFRPDVVIIDIALPGRDGYWLLTQLKTKDIPAIAVTALPIHECDLALAAGFRDWLSKPMDFDRLLESVMRFQPAN